MNRKIEKWMIVMLLSAVMIAGSVLSASAAMRTRIVVLPFYVEQGEDADTGRSDLGLHYRRMSGFIENQLVSHNFEVIDPFAKDSSDKEISRVMETAREDSARACLDMANRYGVDAVYIVWLKVKARRTADGYWKASAILDGKGYDSAGRSLGANVMKTFKVTRRDFDESVAVVEKEVGDVVGRTLTDWSDNRQTNAVVSTEPSQGSGKGILAQNIDNQAQYIDLTLLKANEYEIVEVFGKVVNTVRGVVNARRMNQRIVRDNPQACITEWATEIDPNATDPFRLQANIMKMINDILDAGGDITIKGVPYRYTPSEMKLLMGIMPGTATTRSIKFEVNRERMRDREFSGRHNPEGAPSAPRNPGFE